MRVAGTDHQQVGEVP